MLHDDMYTPRTLVVNRMNLYGLLQLTLGIPLFVLACPISCSWGPVESKQGPALIATEGATSALTLNSNSPTRRAEGAKLASIWNGTQGISTSRLTGSPAPLCHKGSTMIKDGNAFLLQGC